jgi:hypothetical protein
MFPGKGVEASQELDKIVVRVISRDKPIYCAWK